MDWCNGKLGFCRHDEHCSECGHFNGEGLVELSESLCAHIHQLEAELAQVKAERDRYWDWIKAMGCETCSGDCGKCDGTSGWVWSGEDYNVK